MPRQRKAWLWVSLIGGLAVLGYFKYFNFFAEGLGALLSIVGLRLSPTVRDIILPLGVSYYTFQTLSYTLDIYRGQMKPTRSLTSFAAFAAFFPHIVAGPITRARQLIPQLDGESQFRFQDLEIGLTRFLLGLFKKLFVADTLALYLVDPVFASPDTYNAGTHWLALFGYAVQIYADFSGYSSMALGVARMLGYKIPENFKFPYLSLNIAEFWRRWHITLSRWLRDYLWWPLARNIPMTGGLTVRLHSHLSLFIVFLVCGLWHRASWTFVVWGGLHGFYIVTYEIWRRWREQKQGEAAASSSSLGIIFAWLLTQGALALSWILFRASSFDGFWTYLKGLFSSNGKIVMSVPYLVWAAFAAFLIDHIAGWLLEHRPEVRDLIPINVRALVYVGLIVFLFHARPEQVSQFIYFQF